MTARIGSDATIDFDPTASAATRVVLVGFMGAGKTALGERWARSGGPVLWFDSDRATLAALEMPTVTDAFRDLGEPAFRAAERQVIVDRATPLDRGVEVWSLGGGALSDPDVLALLGDACVVWLDAPAEVLWKRVAGSDRPLARDWDAFRALHETRRPMYERAATVRVDATAELEDLGLARLLADHLPPNWFGSGLAVGDGLV
ncbi:MAG: 3-dehydroquinate synthase, partial [Thermoleophilia bacterium]|nr:3-dehydroquinate synthase [Thermoleophilia bacterium]